MAVSVVACSSCEYFSTSPSYVIAGPVSKSEEVVYVELDLQSVAGSRWMFDSAGHYNRPDVFRFEVVRPPNGPEQG